MLNSRRGVVYKLLVNHGRSSANTEVAERFLFDNHASAGFLRRVVVVGVGEVSHYGLYLVGCGDVLLCFARLFRALKVLVLGTLLLLTLQFLVAIHMKPECCKSRIIVFDGYNGREKAAITFIVFVAVFVIFSACVGGQVICDSTMIKNDAKSGLF